ncbi:MAG: hypothetical protein E7310_03455 [Clostridiales bacterium]|nr:hypothetical protein [Clostridiales bacterium]
MKSRVEKIIACFLIFLMMFAMVLPTLVLATNGENTTNENEFKPDELEGEKEDELENQIEGQLNDISQVKLNRKIKFTGKLYKAKMFDILNKLLGEKTSPEYNVVGEYTNQLALVTDILTKKSEGMIGVAFIEEGKKMPTIGYIKFEECKVDDIGEYITYDFNLEDGARLTIEINGEKYPITSETTVQMIDGGIQIGEDVVLLQEGQKINIVNVDGSCSLDIGNGKPSVTGGGTVSVLDKITVNGDATITMIDKGVEVSGNASINNSPIGNGKAQITYDKNQIINVNVVEAGIMGNTIPTETINMIANGLIKAMLSLIKNLLKFLVTTTIMM